MLDHGYLVTKSQIELDFSKQSNVFAVRDNFFFKFSLLAKHHHAVIRFIHLSYLSLGQSCKVTECIFCFEKHTLYCLKKIPMHLNSFVFKTASSVPA